MLCWFYVNVFKDKPAELDKAFAAASVTGQVLLEAGIYSLAFYI